MFIIYVISFENYEQVSWIWSLLAISLFIHALQRVHMLIFKSHLRSPLIPLTLLPFTLVSYMFFNILSLLTLSTWPNRLNIFFFILTVTTLLVTYHSVYLFFEDIYLFRWHLEIVTHRFLSRIMNCLILPPFWNFYHKYLSKLFNIFLFLFVTCDFCLYNMWSTNVFRVLKGITFFII